jgi:outer membrane protein assembly factor BamB
MAISRKYYATIILSILLVSSVFGIISPYHSTANAQTTTSTPGSSTSDILNQYEWSWFQGDSSFTRFSTGPAPDTSNILWKANITNIQPYLAAFNGLIFACTTNSVIALDQAGNIAWNTTIPMNGTWPEVHKIDDSHMVVEGTCLDPSTGRILWSSTTFSEDTSNLVIDQEKYQALYLANVYSPEEKMFYIKAGSYIEGWNFSDPSVPPNMVWRTYVIGSSTWGEGITYGGGVVFPGSFLNQQIALNATTGAVMWSTLTKGPMIFNGAYSDGRFVRGGTDDNTMYCFNATTGDILWTFTPKSDPEGYFITGPAIAYGMVYEMNKNGNLYAVDLQTGNMIWKYKGPDDELLWPGMPSVADGKVYVTTGQAAFYGGKVGLSEFACVDAYTGKAIWTLPMEAMAPRESVAIAYGKVYLIPGNITTEIDLTSGNEYTRDDQVWCIGASSISVSNWSSWRADSTHSSTAEEGPTNLDLTWKFTTNGSVISSPTVVNGIVYFGSQDKNIYAVGAWSGSLIWSFATNDAVESSLAVANGKVYTGGDDGYVYCLDAYTGALKWQTFVNGNLPFTFATIVLKSSPAVANGIVYVGSLDGYMYALNADNGNIVWKYQTQGPIESSPAVSDGAVFFTSHEPTTGALYKLNAANGDLMWKQALPYEQMFTGGMSMLGSPSVAAGMVFAPANLRTYYAINEDTGAYIWNFSDPSATEFIYMAPIYVNGNLYIIDKFSIACLDAATGHQNWSFFTGDELYIAPSYADGKIYDVTSERRIFILDANNEGTKLANYTMPSSSWSSPTIANGRLYIGCNDWNVYCFSSSSTASNPAPASSASPSASSPSSSTTLASDAYLKIVLADVVIVIIVVAVAAYFIRKRLKK